MSGKVIHISDDLHARIKEHCDPVNQTPSVWARHVMEEVLAGSYVRKDSSSLADPVSLQKTFTCTGEVSNGRPSPWERPPFWEKRGKGNEEANQLEEDFTAPQCTPFESSE